MINYYLQIDKDDRQMITFYLEHHSLALKDQVKHGVVKYTKTFLNHRAIYRKQRVSDANPKWDAARAKQLHALGQKNWKHNFIPSYAQVHCMLVEGYLAKGFLAFIGYNVTYVLQSLSAEETIMMIRYLEHIYKDNPKMLKNLKSGYLNFITGKYSYSQKKTIKSNLRKLI